MTRLDDIRAREQLATKGPWRAEGRKVEAPLVVRTVAEVPYRGVCSDPADECNREFIAHARMDIPYLLDLVERAIPLVQLAALRSTWPGEKEAARAWQKEVAGE